MRYVIAFLLAALLASTAAAQSIDVSKLTTAQKAELAAKLVASTAVTQDVPAESKAPPKPVAERTYAAHANEWAIVGRNLGQGLVAVAKEAGMAASEFASTPLGQVATGILIYKIIGRDIINFILGLMVMVVGYVFTAKLVNTLRYDKVVYESVPFLWNLTTRRRIKEYTTSNGEAAFVAVLIGVAGFIVTTIAGYHIIK